MNHNLNINDNLCVSPIKNYIPPNLPTLAKARSIPSLKALPLRWKKNAAVMACLGLGLASTLTLTGCRLHHFGGAGGDAPFYIAQPTETDAPNARYHYGGAAEAPFYVAYPTEQEVIDQIYARLEEAALDIRTHWGGSGAGPFYVAHITEQEAFGFIHARLESVGLNLDATPPEYTIFSPDGTTPIPGLLDEKGIDLFDSGNRVAIVNISWENSQRPFSPTGSELARIVSEEFSNQIGNISLGVFLNPGYTVCGGRFFMARETDEIEDVTPEEKEAARYILIRDLTAQVDEFIARLQTEGIIP